METATMSFNPFPFSVSYYSSGNYKALSLSFMFSVSVRLIKILLIQPWRLFLNNT